MEPDGYNIVNYDKLTYAGNLANLESVGSHPGYRFVRGDICDPAAVTEAMSGCNAVVHFAAESHVDRSIYEPAPVIDTNVRGTFVVLQAARQLKVDRLLHVSTDEVYGDLPPGVVANESHSLHPSSPYSASKAGADLLVLSFVRTYGFPAVIVRASNNYGPYQFPEKFLPLLIANALEDRPLPVYGDGRQQRNWLHVEDNCRAILTVLASGRIGEVYNIGGPDVVENLEIVNRLLGLLNKPVTLVRHVTDRPGHDRRYALDYSKISEELNWHPRIALDDGLRLTVDWYRKNVEWVDAVRGGEYLHYYEKYYAQRDSSLQAFTSPHKITST